MDTNVIAPAVGRIRERMGVQVAIPHCLENWLLYPCDVRAGNEPRTLVLTGIATCLHWMNRAKGTNEPEIFLVCALPVPTKLGERSGAVILLGEVNSKNSCEHINTINHGSGIVDEVNKVERAPVLIRSRPKYLFIQVSDRITNPVLARADAIPCGKAPKFLLLESLFHKRNLLRNMFMSSEQVMEPLDKSRVEMYLERLFALHRYTSISPDISLGSKRSRASRAATIRLLHCAIAERNDSQMFSKREATSAEGIGT